MSIDLNKARDIFVAAVGEEPAARAELIAARCGDDAALRRHVEDLLRADADAGSFLDRPAVAAERAEERRPGRDDRPFVYQQTQRLIANLEGTSVSDPVVEQLRRDDRDAQSGLLERHALRAAAV